MDRSRTELTLCATIAVALLLPVSSAFAQRPLQTLHRFTGGADGENPAAAVVEDSAGNFYGTTEYGGENGYYGTVFEMTPPTWYKTTLYAFHNDGDGARPTDALILDSAGNLYGTTSDSNAGGYGNVFELSPPGAQGGDWTETVLYSFQGGPDGADPYGGLTWDPEGNLYGTTETSVFELSPPTEKGGAWTLTVLHDFVCCTTDGWSSEAGLVRDSKGNLYGTTLWGGNYTGNYCQYIGCGTVFEVSPPSVSGGAWTETVLYRFQGEPDGFNPLSALALDSHGNLYGNTYSGGSQDGGTVFELSPPAQQGGAWTETILHNFAYSKTDGAVPVGTLIFDKSGNLYGATEFGGNQCNFDGADYGCGTAFELSPALNGSWNETLLHLFPISGPWPRQPGAGLYLDQQGNLLGTTLYGGDDYGTVFQIRLSPAD
jgi:uncharacterized repeat protein (TIGR03803 family)